MPESYIAGFTPLVTTAPTTPKIALPSISPQNSEDYTPPPLVTAMARQEGFFDPSTRAARNHNPTNIEDGSFARAHGAVGSDGRFAIFPDDSTGFKASHQLLAQNYGNMNLEDAIAKWAPSKENNTKAYVSNVSQKLGVDPSKTKVSDLLGAPGSQAGGKYIAGFSKDGGEDADIMSMAGAGLHGLTESVKNFLPGVYNAITNPKRTYMQDVAGRNEADARSAAAQAQGDLPTAMIQRLASVLPLAGPAISDIWENIQQGKPNEAAEGLGGFVGATKVAPRVYAAIPGRIANAIDQVSKFKSAPDLDAQFKAATDAYNQRMAANQAAANKAGAKGMKIDPEVTIDNASDLVKQNNPEVVKEYNDAVANGELNKWLAEQNGNIRKANLADPKVSQLMLMRGYSPNIAYRAIMGNALKTVEGTRDFIASTGETKNIGDLAARQLAEKGLDVKTGDYSATDTYKELADPVKADIYKTALGSNNYSNAMRLWKAMSDQEMEKPPVKPQAPQLPAQEPTFMNRLGKMSLYVAPRLVGMGIGEMFGHPWMGYAVGAGTARLIGLEKYMSRAATNPTLSRALFEGLRTPSGAPSASLTSKIILQGFKGVSGLALQDEKGRTIPVQIDDKGQLQPAR